MYELLNYWSLAMPLFTFRVNYLFFKFKLSTKLTQILLPSNLTLPLDVRVSGSSSGVSYLSNYNSFLSLDCYLAAVIFIFTLSFAEWFDLVSISSD